MVTSNDDAGKVTKKPAAAKAATQKKAAAKPKAAAAPKPAAARTAPKAAAKPAAASVNKPAASEGESVKKKALYDRVAALSGAKKRDVKVIVEATLAVLGKALSDGEELQLPPLGKLRVSRQKSANGSENLVLRLRRAGGATENKKEHKEGVAPVGEDD